MTSHRGHNSYIGLATNLSQNVRIKCNARHKLQGISNKDNTQNKSNLIMNITLLIHKAPSLANTSMLLIPALQNRNKAQAITQSVTFDQIPLHSSSLFIVSHSHLLPYLRCRRTKRFLFTVMTQSCWKGGLKILITTQTFERDSFDCSLFFVVDVVSNDEDYFLHFILNELEGPFYFLLICLFGQTLAYDLDAFTQSLSLFSEAINRYLFLEFVFKSPMLSFEHADHILYQFFIHPSLFQPFHLPSQIRQSALLFIDFTTCYIQLISKQYLIVALPFHFLLQSFKILSNYSFNAFQFE